jgi:hypothetical protein
MNDLSAPDGGMALTERFGVAHRRQRPPRSGLWSGDALGAGSTLTSGDVSFDDLAA